MLRIDKNHITNVNANMYFPCFLAFGESLVIRYIETINPNKGIRIARMYPIIIAALWSFSTTGTWKLVFAVLGFEMFSRFAPQFLQNRALSINSSPQFGQNFDMLSIFILFFE